MRKLLTFAGSVMAVMALAVPAMAQTFDPTAEVTTLTTTAVGQLGPIVIAVASGAIGLAALWFGVKFVYKLISSGGKRPA